MWIAISIVTGIIIVLLFLLLCSTVTLTIMVERSRSVEEVEVQISAFFGFLSHSTTIPLMEILEEQEEELKEKARKEKFLSSLNGLKNVKSWIKRAMGTRPAASFMLRKTNIKTIQWETNLGVGNAASTAVGANLLLNVKIAFFAILSHYTNLLTVPELIVTPIYEVKTVQTYIRCMITFKLGHAMIAVIKLMKSQKKLQEA